MKIFYVEDAEFRGTFIPLNALRYDPDNQWYVERDECTIAPESLCEFKISLDDVRVLTQPNFLEFDEVRSWTPVSTDDERMKGCVAFGPNEDIAVVVQLGDGDCVETMHLHVWHLKDRSIIPEVVRLFQRIAERWVLLLETLNTQQIVVQDESVMKAYLNDLLEGG